MCRLKKWTFWIETIIYIIIVCSKLHTAINSVWTERFEDNKNSVSLRWNLSALCDFIANSCCSSNCLTTIFKVRHIFRILSTSKPMTLEGMQFGKIQNKSSVIWRILFVFNEVSFVFAAFRIMSLLSCVIAQK